MRHTLLLVLVAGLLIGCGKTHPVRVDVDPSFESGEVEKIAVFPFSSALHQTADPDRIAPRTFDEMFRVELDKRTDYSWLSPNTVAYALQSEELEEASEEFLDGWRQKHEVDKEFLMRLGEELKVDGVLVGVVDVWQQDEVDPREAATPTTYVGATVTIFAVKDGTVLFEAADEDYLEGARSEDRNEQIVRSGSGKIYSDARASAFKAPPPEEVALKVVKALVGSIPAR